MSKEIIFGQINSSMTRVLINVDEIEKYFYKGWDEPEKKKFYEQHVGSGKFTLYLIPKDTLSELTKIVTKARNDLEDHTVPHGEGTYKYFTEKSLTRYMKLFKQYEKEFNKKLNKICSKYDDIRDKFLKDACQFVNTKDEKEELFQLLNANIMDEINFRDQFMLKLTIIDDDELTYRNCLGKAIGIAYDLVKLWQRNFTNNNKRITSSALNQLEEKMELIADYDIRKNPELQHIFKYFYAIKDRNGTGSITELNLNTIESQLSSLASKYDVTKFLKR